MALACHLKPLSINEALASGDKATENWCRNFKKISGGFLTHTPNIECKLANQQFFSKMPANLLSKRENSTI